MPTGGRGHHQPEIWTGDAPKFAPQHQTVPSASSAQLCPFPLQTADALESVLTCTGVDTAGGNPVEVVPFSTSPSGLKPQQKTFPAAVTAQTSTTPTPSETTPLREGTVVGAVMDEV